MPNRIIRSDLLDSERYHSVDIRARLAFFELLLCADDFGLLPVNPIFLRRHLTAFDGVDNKIIEQVLADLLDHDLIRIYESGGASYAIIPRFRNVPRAKKTKWPLPPDELGGKEIKELIEEMHSRRRAYAQQVHANAQHVQTNAPETVYRLPITGTVYKEPITEKQEQKTTTTASAEEPQKNPDSDKSSSESASVPDESLKTKRKSGVTFDTFLAQCKAKGEKAISDYKPIMDFTQKIGLPMDFTVLCWDEFKRRHSKGGLAEGKRYADWRRAFRNCLEGNWYRLWYFDQGSGKYVLTSNGVAADRATA